MLLNVTINELKLIRQAIDELVRQSVWDEVEEYSTLLDKIDKEIEYYDFATQEEAPFDTIEA